MNRITKLFVTIAATGLGFSMLGASSIESSAESKAQIGQPAPGFTLTDMDGKEHTLSDYTADGQIVVLEWFSPVCPFVKKHYRDDTMTMINLEKEFKDESIVWLRVNSANASNRAADRAMNKKMIEKWGITSPVLMDASGAIGKAYGSKHTPSMYIIDATGTLVYRGAIDNNPNAQAPGDINYVQTGLTQLLAGESITTPTTKAYGCSVKY